VQRRAAAHQINIDMTAPLHVFTSLHVHELGAKKCDHKQRERDVTAPLVLAGS
jgi:hypothetical protein